MTHPNHSHSHHHEQDPKDLTRIIPMPLESLDDGVPSSPDVPPHPKKNTWLIPTLYKVQKYSAYSFVSFVGIHVTSVVVVPILPVDQGIKDEVFALAKAVYSSIPMYETVCIFGAASVHLLSGLGIRVYRWINGGKRGKSKKEKHELKKLVDDDDEIGFGGLSNLVGLGYRKSITVRYFNLTPLQFSGYAVVPFLLFHAYKFRFIPWSVEGDSSLINLEYVSYVLNLKHPAWNTFALCGLVWVMAYHATNGLLKLQKKFSKGWKKLGLAVVNGLGVMGMIAVYLYKNDTCVVDVNGFLGKSFAKYIHAFWV